MKSLFLLLTLSLSSVSYGAKYFVAPSVGMINLPKTNGDTGYDGFRNYGLEALYFQNHWIYGVKYERFEGGLEGNDSFNVKNSGNIFSVQGGWRLYTSEITPYAFVGIGALLQHVSTNVQGREYNDYSNTPIYKFGLGVLAQIDAKWMAGFTLAFYPQNAIRGFSYLFSVGVQF